jgi:hypothetical protein
MTIVCALPASRHYPEGGEALFARMTGATIVRIGAPEEDGIEGGGLVIDYIPSGETSVYRVVFAFNDSGMWVVLDTSAASGPIPA